MVVSGIYVWSICYSKSLKVLWSFPLAVSSQLGIAKFEYMFLHVFTGHCVFSLLCSFSGVCERNGARKVTVCLSGFVFIAKTNLRSHLSRLALSLLSPVLWLPVGWDPGPGAVPGCFLPSASASRPGVPPPGPPAGSASLRSVAQMHITRTRPRGHFPYKKVFLALAGVYIVE